MRVLLVNMPFAGLRPAMGLGLLSGHLRAMGVEVRSLYANLRFADRVGFADYRHVAERCPSQALGGDWVFARAAFGPRDAADDDYLAGYAERFAAGEGVDGAAVLRRCRAAAGRFVDDLVGEVDWASYDVVGFTSTFAQNVAALAVARRIKERWPRVVTVFGGANCEGVMGLRLHRSFPYVDHVCTGEGDRAFPALLASLMSGGTGADVPGVVRRVAGESRYASLDPEPVRDLDTLPYPDFTDFFAQRDGSTAARSEPRTVLMESSRGCWWGAKHHCTFCGLNGSSMAYRAKSADRVLAELIALRDRYQPVHVQMVDNILDMRYFRDLIPELRARELDLGLFFEVKANLTRGQIEDLREAGIRTIQPGIESLSTAILRSMRKGTTAMQNVQLLKWCAELGVKPYWNLIYGFPGEDPADYDRTAETIAAITHLCPPFSIGQVRLDRFSPLFFDAASLGIRDIRPDRSYRAIYPLPEDDLFDLAYYFEHGYADGRDPRTYIGRTRAAVRTWQAAPRGNDRDGRGLVYADHDDLLAVWDFRPGARRMLTILEGLSRDLFLYCDQHRSAADLTRHFAPADITADLKRLVTDRLILELDARYLSLAVPA